MQIEKLALQLKQKDQQLTVSSECVSKITQEKQEERQQLIDRIELLKSELDAMQQDKDEVKAMYLLSLSKWHQA